MLKKLIACSIASVICCSTASAGFIHNGYEWELRGDNVDYDDHAIAAPNDRGWEWSSLAFWLDNGFGNQVLPEADAQAFAGGCSALPGAPYCAGYFSDGNVNGSQFVTTVAGPVGGFVIYPMLVNELNGSPPFSWELRSNTGDGRYNDRWPDDETYRVSYAVVVDPIDVDPPVSVSEPRAIVLLPMGLLAMAAFKRRRKDI